MSVRDAIARIERSTRTGRLSPRILIVDPVHRTNRAAILVGTARSGTTKLAEILTAARRARLIFEPCHTYRSPLAPESFTWGQLVEPGASNVPLRRVWEACLTGRARSTWTDSYNQSRVSTRRLVKAIEVTNAAGWLRSEFPEVPVLYIVRHPFAVASSVAWLYERESGRPGENDWGRQVGTVVEDLVDKAGVLNALTSPSHDEVARLEHRARDPFDRTVLRWCLENALALTRPRRDVMLVFYEHLFGHPEDHLAPIARHLGLPLSRSALADVERPSRTDWRSRGRERRAEERIGNWVVDLDPKRRRAGMEILELFGLDRFYGDGPLPLVTASGWARRG